MFICSYIFNVSSWSHQWTIFTSPKMTWSSEIIISVKPQKFLKIYKFSQKIPFKKIYIFWKNVYIPILWTLELRVKTPEFNGKKESAFSFSIHDYQQYTCTRYSFIQYRRNRTIWYIIPEINSIKKKPLSFIYICPLSTKYWRSPTFNE